MQRKSLRISQKLIRFFRTLYVPFPSLCKIWWAYFDPLFTQNLRTVYDKHGRAEDGPLGGAGGVEDPSAFFAAVFGGDRYMVPSKKRRYILTCNDRFYDYIGEISLMREMTKVTEVMMTEEEREEMEKELRGETASPGVTQPPTPGVTSTPHAATSEKPNASNTEEPSTTTQPQDGPSAHVGNEEATTEKQPPPTEASTSAPAVSETPLDSSTHAQATSSSVSGVTTPGTPDGGKSTPTGKDPRRRGKLTAEQKQKIDAIGEERDKAMEKRIEELTTKLKDVCSKFLRVLPMANFNSAYDLMWSPRSRAIKTILRRKRGRRK